MWEIAGVMISGISLANDLLGRFQDLGKWTETDLLVDGDYLALALSRGLLDGAEADFTWSAEDKAPSRELRGTHTVVIAYNADRKIKYRLCRGRPGDRLILMKKNAAA